MTDYCKCKNQSPEEIKRGVYVCENCGKDIDEGDLAIDAPEPDDNEADMSTCSDLVPDDSAQYEERRVEDVTFDHYHG